ncbi:MAG: DNA double-strand break repair nuclease NurA, partial [Candidatus Anstonellales archaeon]
MIEKIKEIAKNILLLEERRRKLAELLRAESSPYFEGAYEKSFIRGIDEIKVNGKVCATDSGIMLGAMHGIDIFVCRAVAVSFLYENSTLKSCEYYPSPRADPEIEVKNALDIEDVLWNSSLFRLKSEIEVSINAVEKLSPDYLFLDGSIVPLVSDKPKTESQVIGVYNEVIRLYIRLYERCREKNCTLVGIIKDSRGKRFLEIVQSLISDES